jgi:Protein of unknown function (DUF3300)
MKLRHSSSRLDLVIGTRLAILAAACLLASPLPAQIASSPVPPPVQFGSHQLTKEELSRLLAPVALYPDALIGLILPASTVPSDVVLGARYLKSGGDPSRLENLPWDESVKSLARYPDVLAWLDQNLEWTASVGAAFIEQPADVMGAIQGLRQQAKAAGNLVDTPQQKVIEEDSAIRIVPSDPEVIYVPQYDPQVVYIQSSTSVPFVTFGLGFAVGTWLIYDFDWNRRCFYRGNWRGWDRNNPGCVSGGNRGGTRVLNIDTSNANPWQPSANARRQTAQRQHNGSGNATRYMGSGVSSPGQTSAPASAINRAQPGTALPPPSNFQRFPGDAGQIPARAGIPSSTPLSNPAIPTAALVVTPNLPLTNGPSVNPQVQLPQRQVPVQWVPQQIPQQRPAPVVNPQPQPQSAPVANPPGTQQPGSNTRRSWGGG